MSKNQISTELLSSDKNNDNLKDNKLISSKDIKGKTNSVFQLNSIQPLPSWTYIQCKALRDDGSAVCCGVFEGWKDPNTQCIAWQVNSNDVSQLWQLTNDGHFLSRVTSNYVMDIGYGNHLVTNNYVPLSSTQSWCIKNGQIVNNANNLCIGMEGAIDDPITPCNGINLIVAKPSSDNNPCFQWETSPSYPLNSILSQPAQEFPQYTGDLLNSYIDVCQQLAGVNDIRKEYNNLVGTFPSWEIRLQSISCPQEIKDQLTNEFEYAQSIVNLNSCYTDFHAELFEDDSSRLNELISLCGLEEGSNVNVSGCMLQVFSGLLYTVLSAGSGGSLAFAPILGNLIQTGINIAVSASSAEYSINPDPFEVVISELWDTLSSNFEALIKNIGTMTNTALQDWGMMQSVHSLSLKLNTPDSLAWTADMTGNMISAAVPGYKISVLQLLMPTKYQIYRYDYSEGFSHPSDIPSYCQWTYAGILFWIADRQYNTIYPSDNLMSVLWDNNVRNQDFFFSQNGWNFPTAISTVEYSTGIPCIANNTSIPMKMKIEPDNYPPLYFDIDTYSSTWTFDPQTSMGGTSTYEITIWDLNNKYIASLNINVEVGFFEGSTISLKDSYIVNGYYLGSPTSNQGSLADNFTSSIIVPIYQNPNN